jgi:hypothetical protein
MHRLLPSKHRSSFWVDLIGISHMLFREGAQAGVSTFSVVDVGLCFNGAPTYDEIAATSAMWLATAMVAAAKCRPGTQLDSRGGVVSLEEELPSRIACQVAESAQASDGQSTRSGLSVPCV